MTVEAAPAVRPLDQSDLAALVALDAELTGQTKDAYWADVFARFADGEGWVGLAVSAAPEHGCPHGPPDGYLFGEVRAFEFGSDACGWIVALGVRPEATRQGYASALLNEAQRCFRALGVQSLRTMVTRTDVPFLSLFRRHGFVGGPFVQLQLTIPAEGTQ